MSDFLAPCLFNSSGTIVSELATAVPLITAPDTGPVIKSYKCKLIAVMKFRLGLYFDRESVYNSFRSYSMPFYCEKRMYDIKIHNSVHSYRENNLLQNDNDY